MPNDIYIYDSDEDDFSTIGVCGPLAPTECTYTFEAGTFGELELSHPKDEPVYGISKWEYLSPGRIIKAQVPIRSDPGVIDYDEWLPGDPIVPGMYYKHTNRYIRTEFKLVTVMEIAKNGLYKMTGSNDRYKAKAKYTALPVTSWGDETIFTKLTEGTKDYKNAKEVVQFQIGPEIVSDTYYYYRNPSTNIVSYALCVLAAKAGTTKSAKGVIDFFNTNYFKAVEDDGYTTISTAMYCPAIKSGTWYYQTINGVKWYAKCKKNRVIGTAITMDSTEGLKYFDWKNKKEQAAFDAWTKKRPVPESFEQYEGYPEIAKGRYYKNGTSYMLCTQSALMGIVTAENVAQYFNVNSSYISVANVESITYAIGKKNAPRGNSIAITNTEYFDYVDQISGYVYWKPNVAIVKDNYYCYADGGLKSYAKCLKTAAKDTCSSFTDPTYFQSIQSARSYVRNLQKVTCKPNRSKNERVGYKKADKKSKSGKYVESGNEYTISKISNDSDAVFIAGTLNSWYPKDLFDWETSTTVTVDENTITTIIPDVSIQDQLFRIYSAEISMSSDSSELKVKARPIVYDLMYNVTTYAGGEDTDQANVRCVDACEGIFANTVEKHGFSIHSDVGDTKVGFDARNMNALNALIDESNGVVGIWKKVELYSNDFDVYVLHQAGINRGLQFVYAKNLTGVTCSEDRTELRTAIRPLGKDKEGQHIYLDGILEKDSPTEAGKRKYCYSKDEKNAKGDYTGTDGKKYHKELSEETTGLTFYRNRSGEIVGSILMPLEPRANIDYPLIAAEEADDATVSDDVDIHMVRGRMVDYVTDKFKKDKIDDIVLEVSVEFQLLGDTDEYKQYKNLDKLFVYDTVKILHKPLGIEAELNCTKIVFDCVLKKIKSSEFGKIKGQTATVASWQISKVDGKKIQNGTVSAGAIDSDGISTQSINGLSAVIETANSLYSVTKNHISSAKTMSGMSIAKLAYPGTNENLLDNWYFYNPANTNGKTEYTDDGESINRWFHYISIARIDYGGLNIISKNGSWGWFTQKIAMDSISMYRGQIVTVSVLCESITGEYYISNSLKHKLLTNGMNCMSFEVDDAYLNSRNIYIETTTTNSDMRIIAMKLEVGSEQTLAHNVNGVWVLNDIPIYEEELNKKGT